MYLSIGSGEGSGMSGEYCRLAGIGGVDTDPSGREPGLLVHSAGAFHETKLEVRAVEEPGVAGDCAKGGDGVGDALRSAGAGAGGKGFSSGDGRGFGGTDLMKDLKERTGRSIPWSDEEDALACWKGIRIWLRRLRPMPWTREQPTFPRGRRRNHLHFDCF